MSNFFLRILQSNLNSQGFISIYPLNEASQDPTGLKTNGSKITELLIVSLLSSPSCQEEDPSFLRITQPRALHFHSILFSSSRPSPTELLLSPVIHPTLGTLTKPFIPSFHNRLKYEIVFWFLQCLAYT